MGATPDRGAAVKAFLRNAAPAALLVGFFIISLSGDVYDITSPPQLTFHVLLRKLYALGAFALTGAAVVPWFRPRYRALKTAVAITLFSAAIEIGQHFAGSGESWRWNEFDIVSGTLGGFIGGLLWDGQRAVSRRLSGNNRRSNRVRQGRRGHRSFHSLIVR